MRFEIEAGHVAAFARAIGDAVSVGVPPTYAAVYALGTTFPQLLADEEAAVNMARLVHAEQEFEWDRHPEVGETITAQGRVVADLDRRGMRLLTYQTDCTDARGTPVCRSRMLCVIRP